MHFGTRVPKGLKKGPKSLFEGPTMHPSVPKGSKKGPRSLFEGTCTTQRVAAAAGGGDPLCGRPKAAYVPSKRLRGPFFDPLGTLGCMVGPSKRLFEPFFDPLGTLVPKYIQNRTWAIPYFTECGGLAVFGCNSWFSDIAHSLSTFAIAQCLRTLTLLGSIRH